MGSRRIRKITAAERPWGATRIAYGVGFDRFWGDYVLDRRTGCYFLGGTDSPQVRMIGDTFLKLPPLYRELCRQYELTFSTCDGPTVMGFSSSFYASTDEQTDRPVSPHIEMGSKSLTAMLVFPHLAHEVSHLWWASLPAEARNAYIAFLDKSCPYGSVEITHYSGDMFGEYCRTLDLPDELPYAANHRNCMRPRWAVESFCDTVAVLLTEDHPHVRKDTTVDLNQRLQAIRSLTNLNIAPVRKISS